MLWSAKTFIYYFQFTTLYIILLTESLYFEVVTMARSYRRHVFVKMVSGYAKRRANRRVRQYRGTIPNGSFYKKLYPQYDISDYKFFCREAYDNIREFKRLYELVKLDFYKLTEDEVRTHLWELKGLGLSYKYIYK